MPNDQQLLDQTLRFHWLTAATKGLSFEAAPVNWERGRGSLSAFEDRMPPEFDSWYKLSPMSWPESQSKPKFVVKS